MVAEALKESKLEDINRDNLLHGLDSEGGLMPPYSPKYKRNGIFYRAYKMSSNPFNSGRWDLKHWWENKYDGLFYKSIKVKVTLKEVIFDTNYDPKYMQNIYQHKSKNNIIGITKEQFYDVQLKNIPKIKIQIDKIING